jgi:hypothetical protein
MSERDVERDVPAGAQLVLEHEVSEGLEELALEVQWKP